MQKYDKYNVNLNGLENLLEGVVAYVEVRTGNEDISLDIAREMKQIGATISEHRNSLVTHVIFRDGTLRTSNWAKKHKIDLIGIGWLAACIRRREVLLSRPWHVRYLEENVDEYGIKKKTRYKKYFKNMNLEEFEADAKRSQERHRKRLEKSLNSSKSDNSFTQTKYGSPEMDKAMELANRLPRPRTPEFAKRIQARIEHRKQTGRYSWESEDENEETVNLNSSQISPIHREEKSSTDAQNDKPVVPHLNVKSRRLFQQLNDSLESLVEPTHQSNMDAAKILPKFVQTAMDSPVRKALKRKSQMFDDCSASKRPYSPGLNNSFSDMILPKKPSKSAQKPISDSLTTISPIKSNQYPMRPLSPLVTEKSTAIPHIFSTPKNSKRLSLRTKLLKSSAKKKYRQAKPGEYCDISGEKTPTKEDLSTVLVPHTEYVDKYALPRSDHNEVETIFQTPMKFEDSITSEAIDGLTDTPNVSKFLDNVIPNRPKPTSYDHIIFIPKDNYYHSSKSLDPDFIEQLQYATEPIHNLPDDDLLKLIKLTPQIHKVKRPTRRSARLSQLHNIQSPPQRSPMSQFFKPQSTESSPISQSTTDDLSNIFRKESENKSTQRSNVKITDPKRKMLNVRRTATKAQPLINIINSKIKASASPTKQVENNRKRPWSKVQEQKELVKSKPVKVAKNSKRFRDSTDSFITDFPTITTTKLSKPISVKELVVVGFSHEETNKLKSLCNRLPKKYTFSDVVRTKEQLVILPDNPKKSVGLVQGFVFGNTFVSVNWLTESIASKKWLSHLSFIIKDIDLMDIDFVFPTNKLIFSEYCTMYISHAVSSIQKYKLRIIIESAGGKVISSFRQAGIVINTRKINAISVKETWILDSVKEGKALNIHKYLM